MIFNIFWKILTFGAKNFLSFPSFGGKSDELFQERFMTNMSNKNIYTHTKVKLLVDIEIICGLMSIFSVLGLKKKFSI